jgi:uncharacterized OB-fold protein
MVSEKKIPFKQGLWTIKPDGEARLLGAKCRNCGEVIFPRKGHDYCIHCQKKTAEDVELSPLGKIVAITEVVQPPGGGFYKGPVPFTFGLVDVDDGVRIETHIDGEASKLAPGARVKLDIKTLYKDADGNEVLAYTFRPI